MLKVNMAFCSVILHHKGDCHITVMQILYEFSLTVMNVEV
jgi:hypothetical protein